MLAFNSALDEFVALREERDSAKIVALFERMALDEQLLAVVYCDDQGTLLYKTKMTPSGFMCKDATRLSTPTFATLHKGRLRLLASSFPVASPGQHGHLVLLHDLALVEQRGTEVRNFTIVVLVGVVFLAAAFASLIAIIAGRTWVQSLRRSIDDLRRGGSGVIEASAAMPFAGEIRHLLRDLQLTNLPEDGPEVEWSPVMLRRFLEQKLPDAEVIVVSNREPYIHNRDAAGIVLQTPASGLVAAIEPIMRACSGTWIAHGSGTADRETVDRQDRIRVPPDAPSYALRRVWLTEDEQDGYYYGLANEGLWPLCHMAFVRPNFRESDWDDYKRVNARFARSRGRRGQHARSCRSRAGLSLRPAAEHAAQELPHATIITFWHIPWPNPEIFGICPWKEEIIAGLLGSSILGFHTQLHCNNFIDTVDRFMEAASTASVRSSPRAARETYVRPYPISIEWPPAGMKGQKPRRIVAPAVRSRLALPMTCGSASASSASITPRALSTGCARSMHS